MPTARAQYDHNRNLKPPGVTDAEREKLRKAEWDDLHKRVRLQLRSLYKRNEVDDGPTFGDPADEWASLLLEVADSEVSMSRWLHKRLTNAQLYAEQADILNALEKAHTSLTGMSYDLHNLLDRDIDVLEVRDVIGNLIPHIKALREKIGALRRAKKCSEVQHAAALRMTVGVVRVLEENGTRVAATADKDLGYISPAVKILKVLGDALKLAFDVTKWRDLIIEAKPASPSRPCSAAAPPMIEVQQSADAPASGGA
jgi:hypothetical protein